METAQIPCLNHNSPFLIYPRNRNAVTCDSPIKQYLPTATDIYNYIYDGDEGGRLDNVIRFYKSMIVKNMRAVTKYRVSFYGKASFIFESDHEVSRVNFD